MADFYAARDRTTPPLPWPSITPPFSDGMDIHTLAIQMGISIAIIERHYSHLTPRPRKEVLTGRRYELSQDEFEGLT